MQQAELFQVEEEVPVWKVARALGWAPRKARRAFVRAGIAHRMPGTIEWHVSRGKLLELMPEVERRLQELSAQGSLGMPGRARPGNTNRKKAKGAGCLSL